MVTDEEGRLLELFRQYDSNKKGMISRKRLIEIMQILNPSCSDLDCSALLARKWKHHSRINYAEFVEWLSEGAREETEKAACKSRCEPGDAVVAAGSPFPDGGRASTIAPFTRHLVLFFDINKTVIMSDKLAGKFEEAIVNEILSNTCWGVSKGKDGWDLYSTSPSLLRPKLDGPDSPRFVSYAEYNESLFPGRDNRKLRTGKNCSFTKDGPGKPFAAIAEQLISKLKNPDGTFQLLIPAFFHLLVALKKSKRSFALCFRTFGEDMRDVAEEVNLFCEGRHPMFPGFRMDGSDGESDYRLHLSNPGVFGTFHRTQDCDSLVLGTQEQPGEGRYKSAKDFTLRFYETIPEVHKVISGRETLFEYLWDVHGKPGTSGFRDYFGFWKQKQNTSSGGKLFMYTPSRYTNRHEVFFDDNIRYDDAHIVQPVNMTLPSTRQQTMVLLQRHLCKVEPYEVIHNTNYFIKELVKMEESYERHLVIREKARKILLDFMLVHKGLKKLWNAVPVKLQRRLSWYDCWDGARVKDHDLSITTDNHEYDNSTDEESGGDEESDGDGSGAELVAKAKASLHK